MSRAGRGGRGGGRGGRGGAGGGFGPSNLPPMGLTFADIQNMSREAQEMYPPMYPMPTLTAASESEQRIIELQNGFASRLKKSPYYVTETTKSDELPRYSDKYRPTNARPMLKKKDLHRPFFPPEIYDGYFNPKKKKQASAKSASGPKINLDELAEDADEDKEKSDDGSQVGSQDEQSDYDVDEEYDNDYAENYFDNGEGDDLDGLGDGGGGEEGGGGGDYD